MIMMVKFYLFRTSKVTDFQLIYNKSSNKCLNNYYKIKIFQSLKRYEFGIDASEIDLKEKTK